MNEPENEDYYCTGKLEIILSILILHTIYHVCGYMSIEVYSKIN